MSSLQRYVCVVNDIYPLAVCSQVENGTNSPEQLLASPTVSNTISTSLPAGEVIVVLYVRYVDSAATSPLGLPAGARLQSRVLYLQPLLRASSAPGKRRLLGALGPLGGRNKDGGRNYASSRALKVSCISQGANWLESASTLITQYNFSRQRSTRRAVDLDSQTAALSVSCLQTVFQTCFLC